MAAYRRVYDSHHLQADCQEPGSAPEPYTRYSLTAPSSNQQNPYLKLQASISSHGRRCQHLNIRIYVMRLTRNQRLWVRFPCRTSTCSSPESRGGSRERMNDGGRGRLVRLLPVSGPDGGRRRGGSGRGRAGGGGERRQVGREGGRRRQRRC